MKMEKSGIVKLASTLAWGVALAAQAALPSGYTELNCLTSTGAEFFDTGVVPKSTTRVVCDFRYVSIPTAGADK